MLLTEHADHAAEAARLHQIIKELQRHRLGRRSRDPAHQQLELGLEDVQQAGAGQAAQAEAVDPTVKATQTTQRRTN